jgi:hypothetical protein
MIVEPQIKFKHEPCTMEIDETLTTEKVKNLNIVGWRLLQKVYVRKINMGMVKNPNT